MNSGPLVFLGLLVAMACSWVTFVMSPQLQIGRLTPATNLVTQEFYPNAYEGEAGQGAQVYRANGCVACHTQQIRANDFGPDKAMFSAIRQSTAWDYLYDQPVQLGDQRLGPDLASVGLRMDRAALLQKLYNPRQTAPGSVMPSYSYLFDKNGQPSPRAEQLVSYLLSRRQNIFIYFAPPPLTNKPAAAAAQKK